MPTAPLLTISWLPGTNTFATENGFVTADGNAVVFPIRARGYGSGEAWTEIAVVTNLTYTTTATDPSRLFQVGARLRDE